jgi:hypothetical protein
MLDALIEFIQGPCFYNQIILVKTKILETSMNLLTPLKPEDFIQKEFINSEGSISINKIKLIDVVKFKVSTLMLSLTEGGPHLDIMDKLCNFEVDIIKERIH